MNQTYNQVQEEQDLAHSIKVLGEEVIEIPQDLYIPPGALKVFLETFEGPLDLLLYLIKKQNLDILDIPVAAITQQYISYVDLMQDLKIELASEYLVMAAMLAEIKSRLLLPKPAATAEEEGEDPRAELIRRLQEYERFKQAAEQIEALPREERDFAVAHVEMPKLDTAPAPVEVSLDQVLAAFRDVIKRAKLTQEHTISQEVLSIRERMTIVLERVQTDDFTDFTRFFDRNEGRVGVTVTLIAILELLRQRVIQFVQHDAFGPIYIKSNQVTEGEDT